MGTLNHVLYSYKIYIKIHGNISDSSRPLFSLSFPFSVFVGPSSSGSLLRSQLYYLSKCIISTKTSWMYLCGTFAYLQLASAGHCPWALWLCHVVDLTLTLFGRHWLALSTTAFSDMISILKGHSDRREIWSLFWQEESLPVRNLKWKWTPWKTLTQPPWNFLCNIIKSVPWEIAPDH